MAIDAKERAEMNDLKRERREMLAELKERADRINKLQAEVERLKEGRRGPGRPRKDGSGQ